MRYRFFAPKILALFWLFNIQAAPAQSYPNLENYVSEILPFATAHAQPRGIPVAICLGQAIIESSYGNSKLATEGNNHFGMKKGGSWKSSIVLQVDDEYDGTGNIKPSK